MSVTPAFSRRALLQLASFTALPVMLPTLSRAGATPRIPQRVVSASGRQTDEYGLAMVDASGQKKHVAPSGFRGHDITLDPFRNRLIMFARRPGTQCLVVEATTGEPLTVFNAEPDHHFFGHGCFSEDGRYLYTSEANYRTGEGKIGVRDAQTLAQIGAFASHGIGPHQIKMLPGQNMIAVANGGMRTHPSSGRKVLNLDTMQPNLSFVDANGGSLIKQYQLPEPKNSIRHLDVADDGTVAVAMQFQRAACGHNNAVPLVAVCHPGEKLKPLDAPGALLSQFDDYMGSVTIEPKDRILAVTSPRGNLAAFWQLDSGEFLNYHTMFDVCGVTVSHDSKHFILTNSQGDMRFIHTHTLAEDKPRRKRIPGIHFDNHLSLI